MTLPSIDKPELLYLSKVDCLFLLAASILLLLTSSDFAKHDNSIAIHESNARQAFAILEAVADQRLLGLEAAFSHLVRLQAVRFLHFFAAGLLAHLPLQSRDAARGASTAHEPNGAVTNLDLVGNVKHL